MQNTKYKFNIPEEVKKISSTLSDAGFENYLVGGCVRDLAMERNPKDWDITTEAKPEEIQKLFPDSFYENEFGTVGVKTESVGVIEVTPYRLEFGYSDFRHPDKVTWAKDIEEDLARRDFTINAMAYDIDRGVLVDPFEGQKDIKAELVRAVGRPEDRFKEDALRMLRALRLASELGFAVEHETQAAIEKHADLLENVSRERVRDEFVKIVMSDSPATALELAARLGLLKYISPEFEKGIGVEQNKAHAYTVWEHLLRSLDHAAKKRFPLGVRLAALLHDVAKPHTRDRKKDDWTFYGHDVVGARLTKKILSDLRFPKEVVEKVGRLVRWHMFFSDTEKITLSAVRRMVRNVGPENIWDLMNVRVADRIGTGRPKETPYRLRKYKSMIEEAMRDPISVKQLAIDGTEIMKLSKEAPGPRVGFNLENRVRELHALESNDLEKLGREARAKNSLEEEKETKKIKEKYKVQ